MSTIVTFAFRNGAAEKIASAQRVCSFKNPIDLILANKALPE
jgi:hypothetical protein